MPALISSGYAAGLTHLSSHRLSVKYLYGGTNEQLFTH